MAETKSQPADHGKILASWRFPEVPVYTRNRGWYVGISLLGVLLLVFAVFSRNALFAIIIVMAWALIFFRAQQHPTWITAKVTEDGIEVGQDFFAYDDIANFWLIYKPPQVKTVYIRFKSFVRPILGIALEDTNPVSLRRHLKKYLPEDLSREDEPASEAYGRLFKI